MSEHRPHWDDSLVEAVRREIYGFLPVVVGDQIEVTCAVIAAVEDWARWEHVPKGTLARIERVRELHHFVVDEIETREGPEDVQHCSECGYIPTDEEPCPTLAALNTGT